MDKVLIYCPLKPEAPGIHQRTLDSIFALEWKGDADIVFGKREHEIGATDKNALNWDITRKYNNAREMAIRGDYDAMMTVESDMILPANALQRLSQVDADVAYGLYVSRHGKLQWLMFSHVTEEVRGSKSLGETWEERRMMWGNVVDSVGTGLGCTLIRRDVLEEIPFRHMDQYISNDWYFAIDAQEKGFVQKHDCGVICGHIDGYRTLWPDVANGWIAIDEETTDIREMINMANGKYIALTTISMSGYFVKPGDELELPEETAKVLLRKRAIKPAEKKREYIRTYEVKDDTDD